MGRKNTLSRYRKPFAVMMLLMIMMWLSLLTPIVNAADNSVDKIELDNSSVKIVVGSSKTIQASVYNQLGEIMTGQTVTWSSDKTEITTVDQNGLVEAIGVGTATVTAACDGVEAACDVTVEEAKATKLEAQEQPLQEEEQILQEEERILPAKFLIIHSSTSTKMINDAAHNIMNLINPTISEYNQDETMSLALRQPFACMHVLVD